ncbi:MAG TPA: hypothetical protein VLL28_17040 [Hyphomicrobiaceae bacterium]|nr:hypothetical protein [Hyphomicrobiaceae bacterium]
MSAKDRSGKIAKFAVGGCDMNVIPFPRERSQRALVRAVEPPPVLGGPRSGGTASSPQGEFEAIEDRRRMQQNLAACLLVVVLIVTGAWIVERLKIYSRTLACLEPGHRHCIILDPRHLPLR